MERVFRAVTLGVLAVMLWRLSHVSTQTEATSVIGSGVRADLITWSASPTPPTEAHVILDSVPQRSIRDWLVALRRSGSRVGWAGTISPIAVAASAIPSPARTTSVLVAAPAGSNVVLRDQVAPFDSVNAESGGAQFVVQSDGPFIANVSKDRAITPRVDSVILKRVLVLADAGWESKFTTSALEESGWKVDAMIRVAPAVDVSQNAGYHIDTARYSAVVALDESASPWTSAIEEYVRSGGGVIIGPAAVSKMPVALRVAAIGSTTTIPRTNTSGPVTLMLTPLTALQSLRPDATILGRRGADVSIAARRHASGRVVQIGYPETWRWRMAGDNAAVESHRQWWSGLIGAVAYAPRIALSVSAGETDNAPYASLVSAIGPALPYTEVATPPSIASHSMLWLSILLMFTFLAEIASRRLRGAR